MSGRKKPLSGDEKQKRMLEYFYETRDVFQLKDLEKNLPKEKGIVMQSVKDFLDLLVADHLVQSEKIGTSNYFWSFPSTAGQTRKRKLQEVESECQELESKKKELENKIEQLKKTRVESDDRKTLLADVQELETRKKQLEEDLQQFKDCDPLVLEKKMKAAKIAIQHANRWTENIFAVRDYCVKKFNMDGAQFDKAFGIKDDFDLIDI